jgi:hypothetical protein
VVRYSHDAAMDHDLGGGDHDVAMLVAVEW